MELFDLFVTWDGFVGEGLSYVVEYRPYPAGGSWIVFATGVTNTYVTIPDIPVGFYEVRVKSDCADGDSEYIYKIEGKEPCPELAFVDYEVISDDSSQQMVRIFFSNFTSTIRVKLTNLNTNLVLLNDLRVPSSNYTDIHLIKNAGQTTVYRVEIANICQDIAEVLVNMGDYSVTGPPAIITTSFRMTQDFMSADNCAAPDHNPSRANTGTRVTLSEPLPQAVTIIFDYCRTATFNPPDSKVCETARPQPVGGPRYFSLTLPVGCSSWACQHFREGSLRPGAYVCIAQVIPAVLNNGKRLAFSDAGMCTSYNPSLPKVNLNGFPYVQQPPCIT